MRVSATPREQPFQDILLDQRGNRQPPTHGRTFEAFPEGQVMRPLDFELTVDLGELFSGQNTIWILGSGMKQLQHGQGLFIAILCDQPARRFREPVQKRGQNQRGQSFGRWFSIGTQQSVQNTSLPLRPNASRHRTWGLLAKEQPRPTQMATACLKDENKAQCIPRRE